MIKDIAFFAYPVTNIPKARAFYEGVLGLTPSDEYPATPESQWIEYNIGAGTLGIGCSDQWIPSQDGASAALEVDDFDAVVKILTDKNVPIVTGPHVFPSCSMIVVRDPDMNKVTLHKRNKSGN